MLNKLFLLSALFLFNSCSGTNKTLINSSNESQTKQIIKKEAAVYRVAKKTEPIKETNISSKTTLNVEHITEEQIAFPNEIKEKAPEEYIKPIKTFNHSAWNDLLQKYVSPQGNVNYKGFLTDIRSLDDYLNSLSENTPQDNWTKAEKLAYWINAYNAFTIKLITDNYPLKSIKDIKNPWDIAFIKLNNKTYTLNDIEHKILRKMGDPRIHFGIVCASVSCPRLQNTAFEASTIETQLNNAAKEFLADSKRNNLSEHNIEISKIFKWFSSDFKQNGSLIDFLNKFSDITISQNAKKSFKDYDWNLNE